MLLFSPPSILIMWLSFFLCQFAFLFVIVKRRCFGAISIQKKKKERSILYIYMYRMLYIYIIFI